MKLFRWPKSQQSKPSEGGAMQKPWFHRSCLWRNLLFLATLALGEVAARDVKLPQADMTVGLRNSIRCFEQQRLFSTEIRVAQFESIITLQAVLPICRLAAQFGNISLRQRMRSHLTQLANDSRPHEKLLPLYEPAMQILGETSNGTSVAAATRIFTQELLQLALGGTPKDMLHKMYKQY